MGSNLYFCYITDLKLGRENAIVISGKSQCYLDFNVWPKYPKCGSQTV